MLPIIVVKRPDNENYNVVCKNKKCGTFVHNLPTETKAVSAAYLHRYAQHCGKGWRTLHKRYPVIIHEDLTVTPESMGI